MTNEQMKADRYGIWAYNRRKLSWMREQIEAGRVVLLTPYSGRTTKITKLTIGLVSATPSGLLIEVKGKKVDYSGCKISAQ